MTLYPDVSPEHLQRLESLRGKFKGSWALLFGNGWRLQRVSRWSPREDVVTIGTNRSLDVIRSEVHCSIDKSCEADDEYAGHRFGALHEGYRHKWTLKAMWSSYWLEHGALLPGVNTAFTGLYAIEVAVFLGCRNLFLVAYDGDDRPGTSEGHFYPGRRCAPGLLDGHQKWLAKARPVLESKGVTLTSLTFDGVTPALNPGATIDAEESGLFE